MTIVFLSNAIISILISLAALASEIHSMRWWLRAFDFPKLQILFLLVISLIILVVELLFTELGYLSLCALLLNVTAIIHTTKHIWPYLAFTHNDSRTAKGNGHNITLLMSNIQMENECYDKVLKMIQKHNADIVMLIETNSAWHQAMAPLKEQYPHHIEYPNEVHSGFLIYSKYDFKEAEVRYLVKDYIPSIRAKILFHDKEILFYGVHPRPPRPQNSAFGRDTELWVAAQEIKERPEEPIIVAGDLNDVGWSETTRRFCIMSGLKDPRRGRGLFNSYNANHWFARWPLDHLFHSDHFAVKSINRLEHVGSDHFPIMVTLELEESN